ncbi:hypothetical protein [Streptomyces sp. ISBFB 2968]|uniref:hypothetical protein n=1 Tax=Streptomyces sp. ISBFB 2968 TaxID=2903527 RepID=UPI002FDB9D7C
MADMQLDTYGSTILDGTGMGTVTLTPTATLNWRVTRMAVKTSQGPTDTPIPQCTVFLGAPSDGNIIDQTWTGSRDTSDCDILVQYGTRLYFMWENGIPGTSATASIYGTQSLGA